MNFTPNSTPNRCRFSGVSPDKVVEFKVPNEFLIELNSCPRNMVLDLFNERIYANIVCVKSNAKPFLDSLIKSASSAQTKYRTTKGGKKKQYQNSETRTYALLEEVETYGAIAKQVKAAQEQITVLSEKLSETSKENAKLKKHLNQTEQAARVLVKDNEKLKAFVKNVLKRPVNHGKLFGDVKTKKQQVVKLEELRSPAERALSFAEGYGLKLNKIVFEDLKGRQHELGFGEMIKKSCNYDSMTEPQQARVQGVLHILDKFAISDEAYHAITMAVGSENTEKSYIVKQCKKNLDSLCAISATPGEAVGAQHEFISELDRLIVDTECEEGELLKIRLSGDGTKVSKTLNFLNFGMGLLEAKGPVTPASGEEGNRTLAVVETTESYESIKVSLGDIVDAVNQIQAGRDENNIVDYTTRDGKHVRLQFSLSGDMKFLLIVVGLKAANSKFACLYCKVPKTERWITSRTQNHYYMKRLLRTLEELQKQAENGNETFCVIHKPLFEIPLNYVVADELHLLLRVKDILIENLVTEVEQYLKHDKTALDQFEALIRSCGVGFKFWRNQKSKKLEWTSLTGNEKKKLLRNLPGKLLSSRYPFIHEDTRVQIANLWADFGHIYFDIIGDPNVTDELCNKLFQCSKKWIEDFIAIGNKREGYSRSDVTPYVHIMAYHLPYLMRLHAGIKAFTGQGLEKVNDDLKLIYFKRCNKCHAAEQTLRVRYRKSLTRRYKYVKRLYKSRKPKVP